MSATFKMSATPVNEYVPAISTNDKMVKVNVGPERKRRVLHEDLICNRSDFFKKAFQGSFQEAAEKEL